ncbi:MAG: CvpA family protein [Deltaproteobacteria bacterium]|jgi:membrane protein required for colicin V production|nr:CvpA family protein [Deltaproteobacteria bacterium]
MNALDIALTVVLAYFLIRGIFRGLVKEVVAFLGIFVAFWVASVYWPNGAEQMKGVINEEAYQSVLSFIVIYLITYFLIGLLSIFVDKLVKLVITPLVSSLFGGIIGLLKGICLSVVVLACTTAFIGADEPFYKDSVAWRWFLPMTAEMKSFLPDNLAKYMGRRRTTGGSLSPIPGTQPGPQATPKPSVATPPGAPPGAPALQRPTDYKQLRAIADAYPDQIKPVWKERIALMGSDTSEPDPVILLQFARDHPNLFPDLPSWGSPEMPKDN